MRAYLRAAALCFSVGSTSLSFFSSAAFAQASGIAGFIYDSSSRPVRGAQISCGGKAPTTTQADGSFWVAGLDRCQAEISSPGMAVQKDVPLSGSNNRIVLTVAGVTQDVVVSALRSQTTVDQAAVAATVFTAEDIAARQAPFVLDLLREVPGLEVVRTGRPGSVTSLFMRGAPANGVLVLVDGIPQNPPGDAANVAHLLTGDIDRIEVVRGPQSTLFGAQASAGVLQVFTRRGDPESSRPHGSVSYERGSFQTDRWLGSVDGGLADRFDYALSAEQFHTVGQYGNDYYRDTTGTANLGYRFSEKTNLRGLFREYDTSRGLPGLTGYGIFDRASYETDRVYSTALRLEDVRSSSFLQRAYGQYERESYADFTPLNQGPFPTAAIVRDDGRNTYLVSVLDSRYLPGTLPAGERIVVAPSYATQIYASSPYSTETWRGSGGYNGTWAQAAGALVFGYDGERQGGLISRSDVARVNNGFYANEDYTLWRRLTLTGGARVEHSSVFGTKFAPRGAASLALLKDRGVLDAAFLRVSAGRGVREPSLLQSFAQETYYVGNPNLRLEKTDSYEAGLVGEWFRHALRTEVSAFRNSFKDLIVYYTPPGTYVGTWANIDQSWARGVEFDVTWKWRKGLSVIGQETWLWSRVVNTQAALSAVSGIGTELPRRPHNVSSLAVAYAPGRKFTVESTVRYFGERQEAGDIFGVTRAPSYWNWDGAGSYRVTKNALLFLRGENLANYKYQEVLGYPVLGRSLRGGVRVSF